MPGSDENDKIAAFTEAQLEALAMRWQEMEFSLRTATTLKNKFGNDGTIAQIVQTSEAEMRREPNFGTKSLGELKEVLAERDLKLGMELPPELAKALPDSNILPIIAGDSQKSLKDWVVETVVGETERLAFDVGSGQLLVGMTRDPQLRREVAKSAKSGEPFELKFENQTIIIVYDPKTQKGSLQFANL